MSNYTVEFTQSAKKELSKLPRQIQLRISTGVYKLSINPRVGSVRPMVGTKSWRLRIGDYRVIYDILEKKLIVLIIKVGHRREIYRNK